MKNPEPAFSLGIEEEYFLVDTQTPDLARVPQGLMNACRVDLAGKVSPEFLQCQIGVQAIQSLVSSGTAADVQRGIYSQAMVSGSDRHDAVCAVVRHLVSEFQADP